MKGPGWTRSPTPRSSGCARGMSDEQIDSVEVVAAQPRLTLVAPIGGVVTELPVRARA